MDEASFAPRFLSFPIPGIVAVGLSDGSWECWEPPRQNRRRRNFSSAAAVRNVGGGDEENAPCRIYLDPSHVSGYTCFRYRRPGTELTLCNVMTRSSILKSGPASEFWV